MIKKSKVEQAYLELGFLLCMCDDLSELQDTFESSVLDPIKQLNVDNEKEEIQANKKEVQQLAEIANKSMQEIFDIFNKILDKRKEYLKMK